jgi:hypothetical protein
MERRLRWITSSLKGGSQAFGPLHLKAIGARRTLEQLREVWSVESYFFFLVLFCCGGLGEGGENELLQENGRLGGSHHLPPHSFSYNVGLQSFGLNGSTDWFQKRFIRQQRTVRAH